MGEGGYNQMYFLIFNYTRHEIRRNNHLSFNRERLRMLRNVNAFLLWTRLSSVKLDHAGDCNALGPFFA